MPPPRRHRGGADRGSAGRAGWPRGTQSAHPRKMPVPGGLVSMPGQTGMPGSSRRDGDPARTAVTWLTGR
jgi:hypothetical protein